MTSFTTSPIINGKSDYETSKNYSKKASIQIARIIELTSDIKMIEIQLFIVFIVNDCKYPFDA
ncbi:hypothetical protein [Methanobrevibacter sp.]|uniref:hypothetical protein n=1 Tax=Methanobrevibacter sp. TaxID=66852 RepID=UPI003869A5F8